MQIGGGKKQPSQSVRQSNLELLRIVAMFFIVVGHVFWHGFHQEASLHVPVRSVVIIGVNLFVLISGYFGINLRLKGLFTIIGVVLFYSGISVVVRWCFGSMDLSFMSYIQLLSPFSFTNYWFVKCYIGLMLLSPLLNAGLAAILKNKNNSIFFLMSLSYINFIGGWLSGDFYINGNGYNLMNFVFIYIVGRYLFEYSIYKKISPFLWCLLYASATATLYFMAFIMPGRVWNYNNPCIVLAAISFFCLMLYFQLKSSFINYMASCMFPVYLLQDGLAGNGCLYDYIYRWYSKELYIYVIIYIICLFGAVFLLEPIRRRLMTPIIEYIVTRFEKRGITLNF